MASADFHQFLDTFTSSGEEAAREGPDTAALARLQDEERVQAERVLLARLGQSDSRAALGLGILRSERAAMPVRQLMQESLGKEKDADAEALLNYSLACYRIEGDASALQNIAHVLEVSPFESVRISAAQALCESGAREAHAYLWKALEMDESGLVRHNIGKGLLMMHGKLDDPRESPQVTIRLMIKAPHVRAEAIRELKAMVSS